MTAAALTPSIEYIENGVTAAFAVPFRFVAGTHIAAKRIAADGTVTVLTYGSDYSVTGGATDDGGTLTVMTPAVAGTRLNIRRVTPRAQELDYTANDNFPAESHELGLDKAMLIDQEQDTKIDDTARRALMVPDGETISTVPAKAVRGGKFLVFDALGNPQVSNGAGGGDATLRADLADDAGATLIGWLAAGVGAVRRSLAQLFAERINIADYGAIADDASDLVDAVNKAVAYAKTLNRPVRMKLPHGKYYASGILIFDLPHWSTLDFQGSIRSAMSAGPAIRIGSSTTNTFGLTVKRIDVQRTAIDTSGGSTGVQIRNVAFSRIHVLRCSGFQDGIHCYGDQANGGVSYLTLDIDFLHDNKRNLFFSAAGPGYCNQITVNGGSFNHSSGYPAVATVNVEIAHFAASRLNNIRLIEPSFEDNSALAVAAIINGDNHLIERPRMENPGNQANYKIQMTANSGECEVIGTSFTISDSNIEDLGAGNSWRTRNGWAYRAQTAAGAGRGVFRVRSIVSSAARAFVAEATDGTANWYARGDGRTFSAANGYYETGIRFASSDGTFQDRGIFVGTGSPEGSVAAQPGSQYVNTAGGNGTTFYVKRSGTGDTGWFAVA